MKRSLSALIVLLLLLVSLGPCGGCTLDPAGILRPHTTAPIPDDPRVEAAVKIVRPSVVEIEATTKRGAFIQEISLGTGVVVRSDGLLVTNDHVIALSEDPNEDDPETRRPAGRIEIRFQDGSRLEAAVLARAPTRDLAFLRIGRVGLPTATLITDLDQVEVGQLAIAIGAASNLEEHITVGQVTGVLRNLRNRSLPGVNVLVRSNVPLAQGNSGGPLIDEQGRVVGINVAVAMGGREGEGTSLTIPAPVVLETLADLVDRQQGVEQ